MGLLSIFSFLFSIFIIWNTLSDLLVLADTKHTSSDQPPQTINNPAPEEPYDDTQYFTREAELTALLPTAIIHLGWMGFVYYMVPTNLSRIFFHIAPLLFAAECILLFYFTPADQEMDQIDFITIGLFGMELYFSFIYLAYCTDYAYRFLATLLSAAV
jgi:hypothetical protein